MVKGGRDRCEDLRINCRFRLPTYIGQFLCEDDDKTNCFLKAISDVTLCCHKLVDGWMDGFPRGGGCIGQLTVLITREGKDNMDKKQTGPKKKDFEQQ